jgi:hypothetical protein
LSKCRQCLGTKSRISPARTPDRSSSSTTHVAELSGNQDESLPKSVPQARVSPLAGPGSIFCCSICGQSRQTRSLLYIHYARNHFKRKIRDKCSRQQMQNCLPCQKFFDRTSEAVDHFGLVHSMVELFLQPQFHITEGIGGRLLVKTLTS